MGLESNIFFARHINVPVEDTTSARMPQNEEERSTSPPNHHQFQIAVENKKICIWVHHTIYKGIKKQNSFYGDKAHSNGEAQQLFEACLTIGIECEPAFTRVCIQQPLQVCIS